MLADATAFSRPLISMYDLNALLRHPPARSSVGRFPPDLRSACAPPLRRECRVNRSKFGTPLASRAIFSHTPALSAILWGKRGSPRGPYAQSKATERARGKFWPVRVAIHQSLSRTHNCGLQGHRSLDFSENGAGLPNFHRAGRWPRGSPVV